MLLETYEALGISFQNVSLGTYEVLDVDFKLRRLERKKSLV